MTDWQSIGTAPHNVSKCLLYCPEKVSLHKDDDGVVFGRICEGYAYGDGMNGDWTFTHWQPLPEPPAA